jgi:hypothetical protein
METEKSILQMLELLLARKEEAEARHERFLARLDGLTSYGEGTTT